MKRVPHLIPVFALILAGIVLSRANETPAEKAQGGKEGNPLLVSPTAPATTPTPARAPHAMSNVTAARLAALAPKFLLAGGASSTSNQVSTGAEEAERRSKAGIIRLPRYIVTAPKLPPLRQDQMLTPKGKLELAKKLSPGLFLGRFSLGNEGVGLAIVEEQLALNRQRESADLVSLLPVNDRSVDRQKAPLVQEAVTPQSYVRDRNLSDHPADRLDR